MNFNHFSDFSQDKRPRGAKRSLHHDIEVNKLFQRIQQNDSPIFLLRDETDTIAVSCWGGMACLYEEINVCDNHLVFSPSSVYDFFQEGDVLVVQNSEVKVNLLNCNFFFLSPNLRKGPLGV